MQNEVKVSNPYVRLALKADASALAPRLRQEDVEEISHGSGLAPEVALRFALQVSNIAYAVIWKGEVVALFGVSQDLDWNLGGGPGLPWMLASPEIRRIRKSFLRECSTYVQSWLKAHGKLEGMVWAKNTVHIQWLRWLGFEMDPPIPYGINNEPFQRFYMEAENV